MGRLRLTPQPAPLNLFGTIAEGILKGLTANKEAEKQKKLLDLKIQQNENKIEEQKQRKRDNRANAIKSIIDLPSGPSKNANLTAWFRIQEIDPKSDIAKDLTKIIGGADEIQSANLKSSIDAAGLDMEGLIALARVDKNAALEIISEAMQGKIKAGAVKKFMGKGPVNEKSLQEGISKAIKAGDLKSAKELQGRLDSAQLDRKERAVESDRAALAPITRRKRTAEAAKLEQGLQTERGASAVLEGLTSEGATKGESKVAGRVNRLIDAATRLSASKPAMANTLLKAATRLQATPAGKAEATTATETAKAKVAFTTPVGPRIARFLGDLDMQDLSRKDLAEEGIVVPTNKQVSGLQSKEVALRKVMNTSANIVTKVQGRPELLSAPGGFSRVITGVVSATKGFAKFIPGVNKLVKRFESRRDSLEGSLRESGITSAQVRSAVVDLVFQGGALAGQTGRGFSDKDFINVSKQVAGATASPEIMVGVLRSYNLLQNEAFNQEFRTLTGTSKFIGLPGVNQEKPFADLSTPALKGVIVPLLSPKDLAALELELERRLEEGQ